MPSSQIQQTVLAKQEASMSQDKSAGGSSASPPADTDEATKEEKWQYVQVDSSKSIGRRDHLFLYSKRGSSGRELLTDDLANLLDDPEGWEHVSRGEVTTPQYRSMLLLPSFFHSTSPLSLPLSLSFTPSNPPYHSIHLSTTFPFPPPPLFKPRTPSQARLTRQPPPQSTPSTSPCCSIRSRRANGSSSPASRTRPSWRARTCPWPPSGSTITSILLPRHRPHLAITTSPVLPCLLLLPPPLLRRGDAVRFRAPRERLRTRPRTRSGRMAWRILLRELRTRSGRMDCRIPLRAGGLGRLPWRGRG
ncbi:hypothetical protein F5B20DRAFT_352363 [Whalleya microplaca]|nr:hypothetical protein F5B20DRAFT_352363 [Whalleya microplaca]